MLHVPIGSNTFGTTYNSFGTTRPGTTWGTAVTPSTTSLAAATWAQVVPTISTASYGMLICVWATGASASSRNIVMDVGVDEAGGTSYTVKVNALLVGGSIAMATTGTSGGIWYYFPLFVPQGSTLAVRAYGTVTTAFRVGMQLLQDPINPAQIRKGSFVETYGVGTTTGTSVTSGTTAVGAWTLIGTTSNNVWWWQYGVQTTTADTSWGNNQYTLDIGIGDGTTNGTVPVISKAIINTNSTECLGNPPLTSGVEFPVPGGTNIYARLQCSGTVDAQTVAVYALGG